VTDAGKQPTELWLKLDLIRFGGRVSCVEFLSSSFVVESLQVLGGGRISIRCVGVDAGERPVAI
jgi:hypothetical protein